MTIEQFMQEHQVMHTEALVSPAQLQELEVRMGVIMGPQLREYVLRYGYLSFRYITMCGINAVAMEKSDMVRNTVRFHDRYPFTEGMIVFENQGDGDYYLVDESDRMHRFLLGGDQTQAQNMTLSEYILQRFETALAFKDLADE